MRSARFSVLLVLLVTACATSVFAASALRITCEGDDIGARVAINGKFKGECPIDVQVPAGNLKVHVTKGDREYITNLAIGDDVAKKVEAVLTLNAAAQKRLDEQNARYARDLALYEEKIKQIEAEEKRAKAKWNANVLARFQNCEAQYPQATTFIGRVWDANSENSRNRWKCYEEANAADEREKPTPIVRPAPPVKPN